MYYRKPRGPASCSRNRLLRHSGHVTAASLVRRKQKDRKYLAGSAGHREMPCRSRRESHKPVTYLVCGPMSPRDENSCIDLLTTSSPSRCFEDVRSCVHVGRSVRPLPLRTCYECLFAVPCLLHDFTNINKKGCNRKK